MKLNTTKTLLLFSMLSLMSVPSLAENREYIFEVNELATSPFLRQFQDLAVTQPYQNTNINLNPLPYLSPAGSDDTMLDENPLAQGKTKEVESIYVGVRTLNTQIPIQIFNNDAFKNAKVQSELFKDVSFKSCNIDHCLAEQTTLLGKARYEMVYKFLTASELSQIQIPAALLAKSEQKNIKFALVQNAYNWNDFFSSGFNLILIKEDANQNAQIVAFQTFLLSPHFIADAIYVKQISGTLESQIKSFNNTLNKYKQELLAAEGAHR